MEKIQYNYLDLKGLLGNTAIVEGGLLLPEDNLLEDVIKAIGPSIVIMNAYTDTSRFAELAANQIDTIIMESTFTYGDKIKNSSLALIDIMKSTGWKPKRVINTMEYGLDKLFVMCEPFGIDVYQLDYSLDTAFDADGHEGFQLTKIVYTGLTYF
jgi:hypothetical protein